MHGVDTRWFRRFREVPEPAIRLVCCPHAGGAPAAFRGWGAHLPADVELLAVCYPGRHDRLGEDCFVRLEPLADAITEALRPLLDRPVVLYGHSMGASVAHEIALRLVAERTPPALLVVSGRAAPRLVGPREVDVADDDALIADVIGLGAPGVDALADPGLRDLVLPSIRADYTIVQNYGPVRHPAIDVPIVAYAGDGDRRNPVDLVAPWQESTSAAFDLRVFHGGHFFPQEREAELVADLTRRLAVARTGSAVGTTG